MRARAILEAAPGRHLVALPSLAPGCTVGHLSSYCNSCLELSRCHEASPAARAQLHRIQKLWSTPTRQALPCVDARAEPPSPKHGLARALWRPRRESCAAILDSALQGPPSALEGVARSLDASRISRAECDKPAAAQPFGPTCQTSRLRPMLHHPSLAKARPCTLPRAPLSRVGQPQSRTQAGQDRAAVASAMCA
eukprot:scaffold66177_cov68-Phaeocystis_antarctica.AAC.5